MNTGIIKNIVAQKGFGFLTRDSDNSDVFFHCTALENCAFESLHVGQRVQFEESRDNTGRPRADSVEVVEGSPR